MSAWAPELNQTFDLLGGSLPVAKQSKLETAGLKELQTAYAQLDRTLASLQSVADRMRSHGSQLDRQAGTREAQRLANAVSRFAEDLDILRSRWDANGKGR